MKAYILKKLCFSIAPAKTSSSTSPKVLLLEEKNAWIYTSGLSQVHALEPLNSAVTGSALLTQTQHLCPLRLYEIPETESMSI